MNSLDVKIKYEKQGNKCLQQVFIIIIQNLILILKNFYTIKFRLLDISLQNPINMQLQLPLQRPLIQLPLLNNQNQLNAWIQLPLPPLNNQNQLDAWKSEIQEKLTDLQNNFRKSIDTLAKIQLGWFSNQTDKSNLITAKDLSFRGYNTCRDLKKNIHDGLRNFTIQNYRLIQNALQEGKPIQSTWHKVFFIFAACLEIPFIGATIWNQWTFLTIARGGSSLALFSFVGTLIYENYKKSNHRKIIKSYLDIQNDIIRLEQYRILT